MSQHNISHSQNFLRDPRQVERLISLSSVGPDDIVYEIGAGKGIITEQLACRCRQVVAIEKDPALVEKLLQRFTAFPNVSICAGDFLEFSLPRQPYKVFANIPFNITHDIVTKLTSTICAPQDIYLGMQREAANKFCGVPRETLYAVLLKPWFESDVIYHFRRSDFIPAPHVDVVMLRLNKRGPPLISSCDRQLFRDFAVHGFTTRQPTLRHIFRDIFTHRQLKQISGEFAIDLDVSPSALPFPQWLQLFRYFIRVSSASTLSALAGSEQRLRQQQARLHKIHRTRFKDPYFSMREGTEIARYPPKEEID
jgi:23S rRNA (adenine-N6)-dimethyltransferase